MSIPWVRLVASLAAYLIGISVGLAEDAARVDAEMCGANSLALAANYLGAIKPTQVRAVLDPERAPFSLMELDVAAQTIGLESAVLHWSDKRRATFDCPAILHVRASASSTRCDHFITCFGQHGDYLCVADFPNPPTLVSRDWVLRFWDGDALYLDAPEGTRLDAVTKGYRRVIIGCLLTAVVGGGLLLIVGRLIGLARKRIRATDEAMHDSSHQILPRTEETQSDVPESPKKRLKFKAGKALCVGGSLFGAIGLAILLWPGQNDTVGPALVAAEPLATVRGGSNVRDRQASVGFQLKNCSGDAIVISAVSTTCSCLVPADIPGTSLAPGEELNLDVQVSVPELGSSTQQLLVFHDGPGSPLSLSVKAEGRRRLPVLDHVINGYPVFDGLSNTEVAQTIVVKTLEEIDSDPWLGGLSTSDPCVVITQVDVSEEVTRYGEVLQRSYKYSVAWRNNPNQREVRSPIYAKTSIDPEPGIFIGSVAALVKRTRFSPSVLHLQRGMVEEECVLIDDGEDSAQSWQISEDVKLPDWLAVDWEDADGDRRLRVALTSEFRCAGPERFEIPLVNNAGGSESLKVFAYPAP